MKTTYEKLHKYSIDAMVFGKSKKKYFVFYWFLIALLFVIGLLLQS
jgi:hypothetical protein